MLPIHQIKNMIRLSGWSGADENHPFRVALSYLQLSMMVEKLCYDLLDTKMKKSNEFAFGHSNFLCFSN